MILGVLLTVGCGSTATPPPEPKVHVAVDPERAPRVDFVVASREGASPMPIPLDPELARVRAVLEKVVVDNARDPDNPWAVVHGMLALGPTMKLADGRDPIDVMFDTHAQIVTVGDEELLTFPRKRGRAIIEPHTDLVLKALTEGGFAPDRPVTVQGKPFTLAALYRHSLYRAWVAGPTTSFQESTYNDTPWALQGLAAWAPPDLAWVAKGGRRMSMDAFTRAVLDQIVAETAELEAVRAAGTIPAKDNRKGIFKYTCGGQHMLQGAAYAVARGFGEPADKQRVCDQLELLEWRVDLELTAVDQVLLQRGVSNEIAIVLLGQRLKFLGHWLETVHKIGALGLCSFDASEAERTAFVAKELVRTVDALGAMHVWDSLPAIRVDTRFETVRQGGANQVYLDFVGDSAHAVRGVDLATGAGTLRF